jgi:hypothetical protein
VRRGSLKLSDDCRPAAPRHDVEPGLRPRASAGTRNSVPAQPRRRRRPPTPRERPDRWRRRARSSVERLPGKPGNSPRRARRGGRSVSPGLPVVVEPSHDSLEGRLMVE